MDFGTVNPYYEYAYRSANGLMGFSIGISSLRWSWAMHGLVLGGMFGFVLGIRALAIGMNLFGPSSLACYMVFLLN